MAKSPAVILFDSNGVPQAVEDGVAIPVGTQALLAAGSDGTDAHVLLVDPAGRPVVVGSGTAGAPVGGVLSIQGVIGGTAVPISGSVTATDASVGTNNTAAPASSTQIGGSDGTNLQAVRIFDADTGAGSQYVLGVGLRKAASGGSVEAGTATDPLRVDPTGVTAQPVTDNAGSLTVDTAQLPGALVGGRLDSNLGAWLGSTAPTVGQKAMANSVPVVISSDQSILNVSGNFDNNSVGPTGAAVPAEATQIGGTDGTNLQAVHVFDLDSGAGAQYVVGVGLRKAASGGSVELGTSTDPVRVDPTGTTTQPISAASLPLPTGAATEATLATRLAEATFTARINTQGQKTMAASTPVVLASDQTSIPVTDGGGSLTVDGAVTANIGTTNGLALDATLTGGTARTRITDGTNTAAVKAASTAAVAADPALVVAISPNNTITTSSASVGVNNAAAPASSTQVGGSDGVNLQAVRVFDGDTGAGTEYVLGTTLRKSASGGTVEAGTATDPLRVDPTGTTTQPISAAALPLPTGAATEATLATRLADATFTARINTQGQKTMAASTPVVLASDQTSIPVTDNGGSLTVDGTVTANIGTTNGLALDATLTGGTARTRITDGTNNAAVKAASTAAVAADPALVVAISPNNTITTSNASVGANNAALPASSTAVGGSDGTNLQAVRVFDGDTGAGTEYVVGAILRKSASGGTVEAGTSSDPLRIDPTGTTTQPVSGTVTANVGTTGGLALDATLTGGTAKAIVRGGAKGATAAADVTSTAEGTDHQALDVQLYHGGTAVNPTQIRALTSADVVTAAQGTAAALSGYWPVRVTDGTNTMPTADTAARSSFQRVTDGTNTAAVKAASSAAVAADPALVVAVSPNNSVAITAASLPLPTGAATEATLATRLADATFTGRINTLGQKTSANSTPVVLASDQSAIPVTDNAGSLTVDSTQLPAALVGGRLDSNIGAWLGSTAPTVGQKTMANSVPIVIASDQSALPVNTVGTHANAWNAAVTGTNGNSTAIDCQYTPYVSVFGTSNGTTTISIQVSQNNTNFYTVDTISIGGIGGGDFGGNYTIGARYVRLQSSTSRTVTATIAGKD